MLQSQPSCVCWGWQKPQHSLAGRAGCSHGSGTIPAGPWLSAVAGHSCALMSFLSHCKCPWQSQPPQGHPPCASSSIQGQCEAGQQASFWLSLHQHPSQFVSMSLCSHKCSCTHGVFWAWELGRHSKGFSASSSTAWLC